MKSTWNEDGRNAWSCHGYVLFSWLLVSVVSAANTPGRATEILESSKEFHDRHRKQTNTRFMSHPPSLLGVREELQARESPEEELQRRGAEEAAKAGAGAAGVLEDAKEGTKPEKIRNPMLESEMDKVSEITGVKPNDHGHFDTLFTTLLVNTSLVIVMILVFTVMRQKFDYVYSGNVVSGLAARCDQDEPKSSDGCVNTCLRRSFAAGSICSWFGWINDSLNTSTEAAMEVIGLDNAMLLETFDMNKRILITIGVPMVCIMCPLHHIYGGDDLPITEISSVAMGNVQMRHPWMYWIHAVIVNLVTWAVIREVYKRMDVFIKLRFKWLNSLPAPRCVTVLVEGIPEQHRTDEALRAYFSHLFGEKSITAALVVKRAPELKALYDEEINLRHQMEQAEEKWEKTGKDPEKRPKMKERMFGGEEQDAITYYSEKLAEKKIEVDIARKTAKKKALTSHATHKKSITEALGSGLTTAELANLAIETLPTNTSNGFVTFTHQRNTAFALHTRFTARKDEWIVTSPPPASDVLWNDLKQGEEAGRFLTVMAYACTFGLYFAFTPAVLYGNIFLTQRVNMGRLQWAWKVFAPGLSLMLILSFVPTILLLIFRSFFTLKSDVFAQHKLQMWYFGFQMFFVVLVTALGESLWKTALKIVEEPQRTLELMADYMPHATHFYMNFLMLQWVEQATQLLRMVPFLKFYFFSRIYEAEVAKTLAEPEDQDYYGMGARSARFTINMLVGIIFSTLSPLISMFCLVLNWLCRMVYGYLVVFAETKKPDLGGVFFVTTLKHMLLGVFTYNILMIAVLSPSPVGRAKTMFPLLITIPAALYTFMCYRHFDQNFMWENLPLEEICADDDTQFEDNGLRYIQPEFIDAEMQAEIDAACTAPDKTMKKSRSNLRMATGEFSGLARDLSRSGRESFYGHSSSEKPNADLLDEKEAHKAVHKGMSRGKTSGW